MRGCDPRLDMIPLWKVRERWGERAHVWDGLGSVGKDVCSGRPFLRVGGSFVTIVV